ncbi:extracellular solute-binding protein [Salicibibacter halophilus]|uniref:extracellular solute-binding protein n=1 Tax=Salicibibacter halophilus TaxID=2502791 RepID=UPI001D0416E5|nr:extracellular solute-binding protein [Salicibibacter halophilus]
MKFKLSGVLIGTALTLVACGEDDSVSIYTHNVEDEMQPMVSALEEETGVNADFLNLSSEEGFSRAEAEFPDVGAEIQWGQLHSLALLAQEEDMLGSYESPEWEDVPDEFKDPEGQWYGWSYWYNELAVNTDLVEDLGLDTPTSWEDLTDPQYEGEIVMPDPSVSGTGFLFVSTIMQMLGEEEAWDYFEALDQNVGQYVESADVPGQMAAQGEYAIGITWDQAVNDFIEEGYPIEGVVPDEGVGYDLDVIWIYEGYEEDENVQQVVDFVGSEAGMEAAAEHRSMVTKPGIEGTAGDAEPNLIDYDALWAADNRQDIQDEWDSRFNS